MVSSVKKSRALEDGRLELGCNYWASHAGMYMWRDWRPEVVESDLGRLADVGLTMLRVFPLWPDFQPVERLRRAFGEPVECVMPDERPVPPDGNGLDPVMLERFRYLADCAERHGLKLVVALLTGWMSGRLFVPHALEGLNVISDPEALRWEGRFIRGFVNEFREHSAIVAWEPGNECNCMGNADEPQAAHWLGFISASIRSADHSRPVWTGMHGPNAEPVMPWSLLEQGAHYDALTTHPYPCFTEHCGRGPLNEVPAVFHSTAETLFYRGISGRPAFVEEIGTLGPMIISEERRCAYIRTTLASAWACNCLAYLWWCAFDQGHLAQAPYRWCAMERELGLLKADGSLHPAAMEFTAFRNRMKSLPFDKLPGRRIDALVMTTPGQDQWRAAYGALVLAKQAGLEIEFISQYRPVPKADFYWLPAIEDYSVVDKVRYDEILDRVAAGAVLLVTDAGNGVLQPFEKVFGCKVDYLSNREEQLAFRIDGCESVFSLARRYTRRIAQGKADVIGQNEDGTPALTCAVYGKGKVFFMNAAPEIAVLDEEKPAFFSIYRRIAKLAGIELPEKSPEVGRTIHPFDDGRMAIVEINYGNHEIDGIPANDFRVKMLDKC